jgi:predicted  nucleic acid-binding Zn ribbon protein
MADRFCRVVRQVGVMTGRKTTIHLDDEADRWRWVCPRGHRSWEPTNNHFWCAKCARQWDHGGEFSPEFHELRDKRSGETKTRDEIRLVTPAGPYEHREGSA